jgi:hypothetical protein
MATFDSLQPLTFGTKRIPFKEYDITFAGRSHIHEYPHADGGAPEKLGRKLLVVHVEGRIDAALFGVQYAGNWPDTAEYLRYQAQTQNTLDLTIPTVGTFSAFIHDNGYKEKRKSTDLSGFDISIDFIEDTSDSFVASQIAKIDTNALDAALSNYQLQLIKNSLTQTKDEIDLFDLIMNIASDIQALRDQFQLYSALVNAKFMSFFSAVQKADATAKWLIRPENVLGYKAFQELWNAGVKAYADVQSKSAQLLEYITLRDETLSQVSVDIFKNSEHANDLLGLNAITDPFLIKAGTHIRYYKAA